MSSPLSRVPIPGRRRLAATLLLFATLLATIGAVAAVGSGTAAAPAFCAIALGAAVVLALIAWGLQRSIRIDQSEQRLDAVIEQTMAAHGAQMCDCGHEHDPDELHVTDACAHDGAGTACAHDCATCVLTALRAD